MIFREKVAYLICPTLKDEIAALRDGNTKVVLRNGDLLDGIQALRVELRSFLFDRRVPVSIRESAISTLSSKNRLGDGT